MLRDCSHTQVIAYKCRLSINYHCPIDGSIERVVLGLIAVDITDLEYIYLMNVRTETMRLLYTVTVVNLHA